ncbi:hypothetical protein HDU93_008840, partial [Gonapodya sp. JEL0774]
GDEARNRRPPWEVGPAQIVIRKDQKLGAGSYADVFLGYWAGVEVAVKILKITEETEQAALERIYDVAAGIKYLHEQCNVIHADIKAPNVLIDDGGNAVLTDFGFAKVLEGAVRESSTGHRPGIVIWRSLCDAFHGSIGTCHVFMLQGTAIYMAPERLMGSGVTKPIDVYAFGLTIHRIWTRRIPFSEYGIHENALYLKIINEDLRPSITPSDTFPPALEHLKTLLVPRVRRNPGNVTLGVSAKETGSPRMRFVSCSRVLSSYKAASDTEHSVSEGQLLWVTHADAPRKGWSLSFIKDDFDASDEKHLQMVPMKAVPMPYIEELPLLGYGYMKWDYTASRPDEVSAQKEERLQIHLAGQLEWWVVSRYGEGTSGGREWGVVPANFLENIEAAPLPDPPKVPPPPTSPVLPRSPHTFLPGYVPGACSAVRPIMPTSPTELAAFPGEILSVIDSTDPLRWRCVRDRPHGGVEVGYVPAEALRVVAWKIPKAKPSLKSLVINEYQPSSMRAILPVPERTVKPSVQGSSYSAGDSRAVQEPDNRRKGLLGKMSNVFGKKPKDSELRRESVADAPPQLPPMRSAAARVSPRAADTMKPLPYNPVPNTVPPAAAPSASPNFYGDRILNNDSARSLERDLPPPPIETSHSTARLPDDEPEPFSQPENPPPVALSVDPNRVKAGKIKVVPVVKEGSRPDNGAVFPPPGPESIQSRKTSSATNAVSPKFLGLNLDPDPTTRADVRPIWLARHYREQRAEETPAPRSATTTKIISVQKERGVDATSLMRAGAAQAPYPILYHFGKGTPNSFSAEWRRFEKNGWSGDHVVLCKHGEEECNVPLNELSTKDRAYVQVRTQYEDGAGVIPLYPHNWTDTTKGRGRYKAFLLGSSGGWAFVRELRDLVYIEFGVEIATMTVADREYVEERSLEQKSGMFYTVPEGSSTSRPSRHMKGPNPPEFELSSFPPRGIATLKRATRFISSHIASSQDSSVSQHTGPQQPRRGASGSDVPISTALTFLLEQRNIQSSFIDPLVEAGYSRERAWAVSEAMAKSVGGPWGSGEMTSQSLVKRLEAMNSDVSVKDIWRGGGFEIVEATSRGPFLVMEPEKIMVDKSSIFRLVRGDAISKMLIWDLGFDEKRTKRARESMKVNGVIETVERVVEEVLKS